MLNPVSLILHWLLNVCWWNEAESWVSGVNCYLYGSGVTKRCRLSWLTNSALVYEHKCGGGGCGVSTNEYSCAHGAQISCGDQTMIWIYGCERLYCILYWVFATECRAFCPIFQIGSPHPPHPQASVAPPFWSQGGIHTRLRGRGGGC